MHGARFNHSATAPQGSKYTTHIRLIALHREASTCKLGKGMDSISRPILWSSITAKLCARVSTE